MSWCLIRSLSSQKPRGEDGHQWAWGTEPPGSKPQCRACDYTVGHLNAPAEVLKRLFCTEISETFHLFLAGETARSQFWSTWQFLTRVEELYLYLEWVPVFVHLMWFIHFFCTVQSHCGFKTFRALLILLINCHQLLKKRWGKSCMKRSTQNCQREQR